ncbi:MAG: Gfo/Idh/MocA family oxidoreductase [Gammaproteobacteria bacterium]|nr:Gfo/Idh/MocA family oxidoreductase [Gammaproteobacteria bacterium]NIN37251.1 Gfo/Idh/MocA family oxidoreductase [Gammaproteobacteria bacterium]NIO26109.1 Gfo/Idh/MocA family oxidoreductase [Gammaproteobacteria bacterium]NIO66722.1 Gfo/Idh/MocA family oxidoreductase [Gammaproteobacteria bacterium]NIP65875.1 Gfo/Idh/MocA family oxidoreductase [Gammaproteobacteria bacterium]
MHNFALIGAAGFVAPRHMKAIRDTGNRLVAAVDPHDSVGVLDAHFPAARFFTEIERFDRHLEKLRREDDGTSVDYVSICSPNYLHDAHVRFALRVGAHAICEKPLVINPWNLDQLKQIEDEHQRRVYTVLQLRLHPGLAELKKKIEGERAGEKHDVTLAYITRRGQWYDSSWKGDIARSGGVSMNIGIHFFDMLIWLYGAVERTEVHLREDRRMAGWIELERAVVRWFLSINEQDLPPQVRQRGGFAHRSITADGQEIDISEGFGDLHTRVYEDILGGGGFGIEDARSAVDLVYHIRNDTMVAMTENVHPLLAEG